MHYLDHAATTPVPPEAAQAMLEALTKDFGNPSAQYAPGRQAKAIVDHGRAAIAGALGAKPAPRETTGPSGPPSTRTAG